MGFELFQKKQEAFDEIMRAVDRITLVLPILSSDEAMALVAGIRDAVRQTHPAIIFAKPGFEELFMTRDPCEPDPLPRAKLPPAKAVESVLRQHPNGLRAGQIVDLCKDLVDTSSSDPESVIYSGIAHLKRTGRAVRGDDKAYRLVSEESEEEDDDQAQDLAGKTAVECCHIILEERRRPMHAMTIAKEALRRGYVGKASGSAESVESTTFTSFWAVMSRDDRFVQTGNREYTLARATVEVE